MFDKFSHLKGSSLLRIMTTSQIWTGIFLVTMVAFMTIRTMIRIKRHGRVLPLLKTISDGPFSSTRTGAEGIILPLLNYRRNTSSSALSKTRKHQTVKERHEKNDTEILNAMKLIEQHKVKFIEEDPSSGREERNKEERQIVYTLDLHTDNVNILRIHYEISWQGVFAEPLHWSTARGGLPPHQAGVGGLEVSGGRSGPPVPLHQP